jgi:glycosyltransferase involved in cell wall biosynthesis
MKFLLITDSYPPEIRSTSQILYDLVQELKNRDHEVSVVTTKPRYNLSGESSKRKYNKVTDEDGIKVVRLDTPSIHKVNYVKRGIATLLLPFLFYKNIKKEIKKNPDIIFVYSPPLTLGISGVWAKKYFSSKLILNVQDIFPRNAVDLGILKNPLLIKFFEIIENWVYKRTDVITVHSEGNRKFLLNNKDQLKEKVKVVHNWIDFSKFKIERKINFRNRYNLDSKFIILFAGVMGPSQGLDNIIDIAEKLKKEDKIHFLFVGDGSEKEKLKKKADGLKNVSFHPFVDKENYPDLLKSVDVGLVSLSSKNRTPVVPGKILGYMASGLPVLSVLNKESDGHGIIKKSDCGFSLIPEDKEGIINAILELKNNENNRKKLGENGRSFAENNFSKKVCVDEYEKIFKEIKNGRL